jgi:hypothetical protein
MNGIVKVSNENMVFVEFAVNDPSTVNVFETKMFEIFAVAMLAVERFAEPILAVTRLE